VIAKSKRGHNGHNPFFSIPAVSASEIDLSWNKHSAAASGFTVERSTGSGAFAPVATLSAGSGQAVATTYKDTGLSAGIGYKYEVVAFEGKARPASLTWTTDGEQIVRGTPHIREDQLERSLSHCGDCSCIHLS
jgi:hypothetical protein